MFQCGDGACLPYEWGVCDGHRDCADGSDEDASMCAIPPCESTQLECARGDCRHRPSYCRPDENCEHLEIMELCKGYSTSQTSQNWDEILIGWDWLGTKGIEGGFSGCGVNSFGCGNGNCVPLGQECDGVDHCGDNSDEASPQCATPSGEVIPSPIPSLSAWVFVHIVRRVVPVSIWNLKGLRQKPRKQIRRMRLISDGCNKSRTRG